MDVLRLSDSEEVESLLARFHLGLRRIGEGRAIPGSYWGDSEAGLIADNLYARSDTPVHSILHETAHFVCMTPERRRRLFKDAGGDDAEENAVCYFQVLLAAELSCISRPRLFQDMDTWGYSFRLGSTARWFDEDAAEARSWLHHHDLIDHHQLPTWQKRSKPAPKSIPKPGKATSPSLPQTTLMSPK